MLIHYIIFGSLNPNTNKTNRITKFSKKYTNKNPSNKATHITTQISIAIATLFSTKLCAKIATLLAQNILKIATQYHYTSHSLFTWLGPKQQHNTTHYFFFHSKTPSHLATLKPITTAPIQKTTHLAIYEIEIGGKFKQQQHNNYDSQNGSNQTRANRSNNNHTYTITSNWETNFRVTKIINLGHKSKKRNQNSNYEQTCLHGGRGGHNRCESQSDDGSAFSVHHALPL